MFRRILLVFTDPDLRKKLFQIILLLIAARLLAHIPIPILQARDISNVIDSDAVFSLLNTISGGGYGRLSFVMLGVGPYITASIVMQLLAVIIPQLHEIQKEEGQLGQQKINRWTRFLTVPLAALNAWGILQFLSNGSLNQGGAQVDLPEQLRSGRLDLQSFGYWLAVITAMTAGTIIIMWIGEIITEFKMGNGVSLLILSGIVVNLPNQLYKYSQVVWPNVQLFGTKLGQIISSGNLSSLVDGDNWREVFWNGSEWAPLRNSLEFFGVMIVTLLVVVFMNDAVRRIVIIHARRGHSEGSSRTLGSVKADLPLKVNIAGVLPIIFAVSFILFPSIISRFFVTSSYEPVRNGAQAVADYLSTEQNQGAISPTNLPSNFLGVYWSGSKDQIDAVKGFDSTKGQELLGFTVSTIPDEKNSFFEGTPLAFQFPSANISNIPNFAVRFNGILAYNLFYFILIIFFTYFYTSTIAFKTDDVAENLQKTGAYIPGHKPGKQTQEYLDYVSNRLTLVGSIFLAIIALVPIYFTRNLNFGDGTLNSIVGGTTLLILVSVTIETMKQIEAQATAVDYERFTK